MPTQVGQRGVLKGGSALGGLGSVGTSPAARSPVERSKTGRRSQPRQRVPNGGPVGRVGIGGQERLRGRPESGPERNTQ